MNNGRINFSVYRAHVDTVSEEETAKIGGVRVAVIVHGKSPQDVESCVLQALGDEAQTQVHGIYKKKKYWLYSLASYSNTINNIIKHAAE